MCRRLRLKLSGREPDVRSGRHDAVGRLRAYGSGSFSGQDGRGMRGARCTLRADAWKAYTPGRGGIAHDLRAVFVFALCPENFFLANVVHFSGWCPHSLRPVRLLCVRAARPFVLRRQLPRYRA